MAEAIKKGGEAVMGMMDNDKEQPHGTMIQSFAQVVKTEEKLAEVIKHYLDGFYRDKKNKRNHSTVKLIISTALSYLAYMLWGIVF